MSGQSVRDCDHQDHQDPLDDLLECLSQVGTPCPQEDVQVNQRVHVAHLGGSNGQFGK